MPAVNYQPITKTDAAARQLETAIDLYFANADSLSVHTLAFASFKLLFDLYPHRRDDDFAQRIDQMMAAEGWKLMSAPANFLKHADRDPDAVLNQHDPRQGMCIIGLATLLYRNLTGDLTLKMRAFDSWVEEEGHDELGIVEVDTNQERVAKHKNMRDTIRAMPHDEKIRFARAYYQYFIDNHERLAALLAASEAEGRSVSDILDAFEERPSERSS